MAKNILAWNNAGAQYYREMGKKENGKPARFYLGADESTAKINVARLEALWKSVETRWNDWSLGDLAETAFPCWDVITLEFGRAIGKGQWTVKVELPEVGPQETAAWLSEFRFYFPMIQIQTDKSVALEEGNRAFIEMGQEWVQREEARHHTELRKIRDVVAPFGGKVATKETLHDALAAYKEWIERTFVDIEGQTTQTGKKQGERADRIKRYAPDLPLSDFGTVEIESIIEFWRTRPKKQNGLPYAFTLCKHTIRLYRHFIRWLHKEKAFPWKKPVDLEIERIQIVRDTVTKYKVETYSKEELAVLWQFASHFERPLLLCALNCGFSISEIGNLDWHEVEGDYIKGLRPKTKVYGEFKLWDLTKRALGEAKKAGSVFTTKSGTKLIARTKGNNVSAKIPAAWYRLLDRVQKHQPDFKRLGFHHLRNRGPLSGF
ncbi:MAG: hypothetical protein JWN70_3639 [Planctomycetaceae bacterium]|nr:hypothetical protein [Planctomycetaceae bacterium]